MSAMHRKATDTSLRTACREGPDGRCRRCKVKSDFSAKRSGAAMYTAYSRLEGYLGRDAAAVAAGPDVIRSSVPDINTRSSIASAQTGFPIDGLDHGINVVITLAVRLRTDAT